MNRRFAAAALLIGAAVVAAALTGRTPIALALLAVLVSAVAAAAVPAFRAVTHAQQTQLDAIGDLRRIVEQVQRRVIATVEKERLDAGDRHLELTGTLSRADHLTAVQARDLLREQNREIDAVIQLSRSVAPRAPMPGGDTGPGPSDLLGLLHLVRSRPVATTVALGASPATIWLAYATEQAGRLVVVEHDADRAERTRADLLAHGLTGAEVLRAPLAELTLDGQPVDWYDVDALTSLHDIGLLVVDGPAPGSLRPALHVLGRRLAPDGLVVTANHPAVPRQGGVDGFRTERPPSASWTVLSHA